MTKTLTSVFVASLLALGATAAQANVNYGTLAATTSFNETLAKNLDNLLSTVYKFTIDTGYTATIAFNVVGAQLSFDDATLDTKVAGGGWTRTTDTNSTDGLFSMIGPGTYKLQFQFDTGAGGGALARTFNGSINLASSTVVIPTIPVPEPETYAMLLAGLGLMGAIARRRQSSRN